MALPERVTGRSKHLANIALVFRHRHGTWGDFGSFLDILFKEGIGSDAGVAARVGRIQCRHSPGGRHHETLQSALVHPGSFTMFNSNHYQRPCITTGSFEKGKNPGLVVTDICVRASRFLLSIGKGDADDVVGRDREYSPPSGSGMSPMTTPSAPDTQGSVDPSNILSGRLRSEILSVERAGNSQGSSTDYGDSFFEEEDVQEELSALVEEYDPDTQVSTVTLETLSDVGSADSVLSSGDVRLSTKVRAATLAYLCRFSKDPVQLRNEFRRLRREKDLHVLHLCGCGLCITEDQGRKVAGCCEPSHLILGTAVMNGHHTRYHEVISLTRAEDYAQLCGIIHRGEDGEGLF